MLQHHKIPIYIWYDGYDPHVEENYKGRASRVNPNANYGLASLNLTNVRESDQGWYECNVFYLDRSGATDNGTWIHLDVHGQYRSGFTLVKALEFSRIIEAPTKPSAQLKPILGTTTTLFNLT